MKRCRGFTRSRALGKERMSFQIDRSTGQHGLAADLSMQILVRVKVQGVVLSSVGCS